MKRQKDKITAGTVADLHQDKLNANVGTQRGRAMLETSIRRNGMGRSVLVDKRGTIIAGNKTVEAAENAGVKDTIVVETDGSKVVVVKRTDLDLGKDVKAKSLGVADNQSGAVGLSFSGANLAELERQGVDMWQFFRPVEWAELVKSSDELISETIPEMEIQPFEHHDYIMVVFRDSHTWSKACDLLNIKRERIAVGGRQKSGIGRVIAGERLLKVMAKTPRKKRR